jgi:hypothetical protein
VEVAVAIVVAAEADAAEEAAADDADNGIVNEGN